MLMNRYAVWILPPAVMMMAAGLVSGQNFPTRPIRIITTAVGGGSDITSRLIAQGMSESIGQQVIVDNRDNVGPELLIKSQPDGHTMLVDGNGLWQASLVSKISYDPVRDFAPITIAVRAPIVVLVHPSVPAKSAQELIAFAKAKPGVLNYGSGGIGGTAHLPVELFKSMAGVNIVNINYKGTGQALTALIANEIQVMFANTTIATTPIKAGRVRALAVTTLQPSALLPDLPTLAASGLPGFEASVVQGIVAPAKTPAERISRLNQEIVRALNKPEAKDRLLSIGVEVVANTPAEFAASMKSDLAKWGKVAKDVGIAVQ